ncbi:MAG: DHH family phosphoesterase [Methyloprofundus sp.]|nr:DHH family phosphoesterase [Methyloprofundus sp.]
MTEKNKWVLYHADCMDGYAAAWAAWKAFGESARYKAVRHHEPLPKLPDDIELYILDFCYPTDVLVKAAERARKIIVLDHHISAQKDFESYLKHSAIPDNLDIVFVQNHSGCMIAWDYFQGDLEPPVLLRHIEDHDLWLHKLAKTEAICKALYLRLPINFAAFEKIKLHTLQREGVVLLKQQQLNVRRLLNTRHKVKINGIKGLAVNAPPMFSSDLGHALAELSGTYGLTYSWHGKRQCYDCALRSIGEFDVAELAKVFGGGGHQNASGFNVDQQTFLDFL